MMWIIITDMFSRHSINSLINLSIFSSSFSSLIIVYSILDKTSEYKYKYFASFFVNQIDTIPQSNIRQISFIKGTSIGQQFQNFQVGVASRINLSKISKTNLYRSNYSLLSKLSKQCWMFCFLIMFLMKGSMYIRDSMSSWLLFLNRSLIQSRAVACRRSEWNP